MHSVTFQHCSDYNQIGKCRLHCCLSLYCLGRSPVLVDYDFFQPSYLYSKIIFWGKDCWRRKRQYKQFYVSISSIFIYPLLFVARWIRCKCSSNTFLDSIAELQFCQNYILRLLLIFPKYKFFARRRRLLFRRVVSADWQDVSAPAR